MTGRHSFTRPTVAEWLAGLIQHPDDRPRRTPMREGRPGLPLYQRRMGERL